VLMCENLRLRGYNIELSNTNYYGGIIWFPFFILLHL
jgi:hypothetical protein